MCKDECGICSMTVDLRVYRYTRKWSAESSARYVVLVPIQPCHSRGGPPKNRNT